MGVCVLMLGLGSGFRIRVVVWLLFDYCSHTAATFCGFASVRMITRPLHLDANAKTKTNTRGPIYKISYDNLMIILR